MGEKNVAPVPLINFHIWKKWLDSKMKNETSLSTVDDLAQKSIESDLSMVTETLAKITALQGDKDKAERMYQQLILKNPEKSDYFAQQIENLKD